MNYEQSRVLDAHITRQHDPIYKCQVCGRFLTEKNCKTQEASDFCLCDEHYKALMEELDD